METNGITIPDAGTSTQYLPDTVGGWMYVVTTTVQVEQHSLPEFESKLRDVKEQIAKLQQVQSEMEPEFVSLKEAFKEPAIVLEAPMASSTPVK